MKGTLLLYGGGFVSVNLCRTGWELQKKNPFIGKIIKVTNKNTRKYTQKSLPSHKKNLSQKSGFKNNFKSFETSYFPGHCFQRKYFF